MKLIFKNKLTIALLFCVFIATATQAQTYNTNLKVGDPVPDWLINEEPTYEMVKQKFIEHYGEDKEDWPYFILELESLYNEFQEFNSRQKNPSSPAVDKFFNNELKLGYDTTKSRSFKEIHINSLRNYVILRDYIYSMMGFSSTTSWAYIKNSGTPHEKTYNNAETTKDGVLPMVLYIYVSKCPKGLLDWYFEDVFPVIDLLYQQDELSELVKTLKSIQKHINKLIDNHDFAKADIWAKSIQKFINLYQFDWLKPELPIKFYRHDQWSNYKYIEKKQNEAIEEFNTALTNNLANYLGGRSFTLKFYGNKYWSPKNTTAGELVLESDGSFIINYNQEFLDEYNLKSGANVGFPSPISKHRFNQPRLYQNKGNIPFKDDFYGSEVIVDNGKSIIFFGITDSAVNNNVDNRGYCIAGEQKYLFAVTERSYQGLNYTYKIPHFRHFLLDGGEPMERGGMDLPFEEKVTYRIHQWITYVFNNTVDEVLNNVTIVPQIYGMKYDRKRRTRIAIGVTTSPREVKTDGKSTTEITATLFEYTPNTDLPATPIEGKKITFTINEQYGTTPGTINTSTVVTDIYGEAKITYTAPTGEALQQTDELINTATVNVGCEEYNVEELAYISFASDKGQVKVDPPIRGIVSNEGIVPPDSRFPALITVNLEDDRLQSMPNTKVDVKIAGNKPLGILRSDDGQEGIGLSLISDQFGDLEFQYFYNAENPPDKPVTEVIEIKTAEMSMPLRAYVSIGLNLVFELVENAYECKGIVNAGEKIPLRIRVKDIWYPKLDLAPIIQYWGSGNKAGNTRLDVKLEIENISTVPKYFLEQVKLENYPEEPFVHDMNVRSFKDKKVYNMLWLPDYSLEDYNGYPRITPTTVGTHYYEAQITLVDNEGEEVFPSKHPARKALFNVEIGLPADAMQIFFISNPFATETKDAKLLATALDIMGFGAILSVTDALYKINNGDAEGLYSALFSEVKGVIFDKVKKGSAYNELAVDLYSGMALAEKIGFEIMHDKTGTLTEMEGTIFKSLYNSFKWNPGQLVVLMGDGNQVLIEEVELSPKDKEVNMVVSAFNLENNGSAQGDPENSDLLVQAMENNKNVIPARANEYVSDKKRNTTSLKSGNVSIYVIPATMKVRSENAIEMKRY
ncbi:MAG: Ig-like domain-containing protein [Bacteroidetes bacterium]|nr:Ig-like domain-containing protein [Bacteroidota bacterium]